MFFHQRLLFQVSKCWSIIIYIYINVFSNDLPMFFHQTLFPTRSLEWWSLLGCCWASCSRSPWERQGRRGRDTSLFRYVWYILICLVSYGLIASPQSDINNIYMYINTFIYLNIYIYIDQYIYISMSNTLQKADLSIPMSSADGLRIGWPHSQRGSGSGEVGLSAHHHLRSSVTEEFRRFFWSHPKSGNQ